MITGGKGNAILYYVGATGARWGIRTVYGDRVVADAGDMTYAEVIARLEATKAAEAAAIAKVMDPSDTPEREASTITFGQAWDDYVQWAEASGKTPVAMRTIRAYGTYFDGIRDWRVATTSLAALSRWRDGLVGTTSSGKRKRTANSVAKAVSALRTRPDPARPDKGGSMGRPEGGRAEVSAQPHRGCPAGGRPAGHLRDAHHG
ncbi:hypothetical protein [Falsiruegeria mediterranea]|uniref:Uncharacterized protein n=1 Tax=Falsiruegeria mediterranea M17 TaxID=1200281 RepID=A0A2R8C8A3_9RHOB|nr:hypothetical protein [Falsiruegeria mediterranea]SPJ28667.1 hypothetical protein TRM7615_02170 [Falsiruegeria mediterranea M17]